MKFFQSLILTIILISGIAVVTMSNGSANALSLEFITNMINVMQKLNMEKDVRGIILTSVSCLFFSFDQFYFLAKFLYWY